MTKIRRINTLIFGFSICLILLFGCNPSQPATPPLPSSTLILAATSTSTRVIPSATPENTQTSIPNTATATLTATPHPMSVVEQRCIQVMEGTPPSIPGFVAISNRQPRQPSYLINLQNQQQTAFSETIDEFVSPDFTKIISYEFSTESIVVRDVDLNIIVRIPGTTSTYDVAGWLDNENILLDKIGDNFPQDLPSLVSYNIRTKQTTNIGLQLPNILGNVFRINWAIESRIIPQPNLDYLLYPAFDDVANAIVLWNINQQRGAVKILAGTYFQPVWSPDGNSFILGAPPRFMVDGKLVFTNTTDTAPFFYGTELLRVDLNGKIERITFLSKDDVSNVNYFTWSPDGKRIAFGHVEGNINPDYYGLLSILDIETGEIIDYCMAGRPKWSADGQYILLTTSSLEVYLVDVDTAQAWLIAENAEAIGWMVAP